MSNTFIFLNTHDKLSGNSYDARFSLDRRQTHDNYSLSLESVQFPLMVYPFNAHRGNYVIYFQENNSTSTTYTASITLNTNYTGTSLASHISTILTAATGNGYTYTCTYNTSTKKFTLSEAGNNPWRIVTGALSAEDEIGYDVDVDSDFKVASTEFALPIDISGTKYVDLISSLGGDNYSSSGSHAVLHRIPVQVDTGFGDLVHYVPNNKHRLMLGSQVNSIHLTLRDDRGKFFPLPKNAHVGYSFLMERVMNTIVR